MSRQRKPEAVIAPRTEKATEGSEYGPFIAPPAPEPVPATTTVAESEKAPDGHPLGIVIVHN